MVLRAMWASHMLHVWNISDASFADLTVSLKMNPYPICTLWCTELGHGEGNPSWLVVPGTLCSVQHWRYCQLSTDGMLLPVFFRHLKGNCNTPESDLVMAKTLLLLFYSSTSISLIFHLTGDDCISVKIWMTRKQFCLLEDCTYSLWININLHKPLKAEENLLSCELPEDISFH